MRNLFSGGVILAAFLVATPVLAFDQKFSNNESSEAVSTIAKCKTLQCIDRELASLQGEIRRRPDYKPLDDQLRATRKSLKSCMRGCGAGVAGPMQAQIKASVSQLKAHARPEIAVFARVFELTGSRLPK